VFKIFSHPFWNYSFAGKKFQYEKLSFAAEKNKSFVEENSRDHFQAAVTFYSRMSDYVIKEIGRISEPSKPIKRIDRFTTTTFERTTTTPVL
jgi:hypothetical protein